MRERATIDELELTAHRHTVSDARGTDAATGGHLREEVRGGLALDRGVGREDHLAHLAFTQQLLERVDADLREAVQDLELLLDRRRDLAGPIEL